MDEEAERKRAAEEMARLRAPGSMCLRLLWENDFLSFEPVVERILAATLARASNGASPAVTRASAAAADVEADGPSRRTQRRSNVGGSARD